MSASTFLVLVILIGILPAAIASGKGHSFIGWWIFGSALFIVAFPMALVLKRDVAALESEAIEAGGRKCPFCAEVVKSDATACRYCGRDLPQFIATKRAEPTGWARAGKK